MSSNKPTDAQRAAFDQQIKQEGVSLLRSLVGAAVDHVQRNPDHYISQVTREAVVATDTFGRVRDLFTRWTQPQVTPAAKPGSSGPKVVDAEFIDDKPR